MSHDASSLVIPYLVSVSPSLYLYRKEGGGGGYLILHHYGKKNQSFKSFVVMGSLFHALPLSLPLIISILLSGRSRYLAVIPSQISLLSSKRTRQILLVP